MKVLFIGNSFTFYFGVPGIFGSLCAADGRNVSVESVTCGGWTLEKMASSEDKYGKIVDAKLRSETRYDVVILQEQSQRPFADYDAFLSGCRILKEKIRANNKNARILLYETWSYGDDHAGLREKGWKAENMQKLLEDAYAAAAKEIGAEISHVGKGMLCLYRETDLEPYDGDRKHQSYYGSYLAAVTHFLKVFPDADRENVRFPGECAPAEQEQIVGIALRNR